MVRLRNLLHKKVLFRNCLFAGICYGFEVMRVQESPNTPFTILFEHFSEGNVL